MGSLNRCSLRSRPGVKGQVPVALSDEERRRLEKLEQELAAADPELAR
ncbi:DUF3040 domain-containing protein, partial [Pseudarthrobacter phenanthrenivorans]